MNTLGVGWAVPTISITTEGTGQTKEWEIIGRQPREPLKQASLLVLRSPLLGRRSINRRWVDGFASNGPMRYDHEEALLVSVLEFAQISSRDSQGALIDGFVIRLHSQTSALPKLTLAYKDP
jgi:hypothetical protein